MPWPSSTPIAPSTITQSAPRAPCASERRTPSGPSSHESRFRHGLRLACARYAVSMKSAPTLKVWTVRPRARSAAVRPRLIEVFPEPDPRPPTTSRGIPTSSCMRCLRMRSVCSRSALSPPGTSGDWTLTGEHGVGPLRLARSTLAPGDGRGKFKVVTTAARLRPVGGRIRPRRLASIRSSAQATGLTSGRVRLRLQVKAERFPGAARSTAHRRVAAQRNV